MKVFICGNKHLEQAFFDAEVLLRQQGHIPINPVKLLYALPKELRSPLRPSGYQMLSIS